jgi:hypothetical protein
MAACGSNPPPPPPVVESESPQEETPQEESPQEEPPQEEPPSEDTLLDHVPSEYATACVETQPPSPFSIGVTAALECNPLGDPQQLLYYQYDSTADMNDALQVYIDLTAEEWGSPPDEGDCQSGKEIGQYTIGGEAVGQLLCFATPSADYYWGYAWTNWNTNILAVVNDDSWGIRDLYQWWFNYAASTA